MPEEVLNEPSPNGVATVDEPFDIEDIIAEATPQERSVRICVKGDLRRRHEELEEQLQVKVERRRRDGESLAEAGEVRILAREVQAAEDELEAHMRRFLFHSIGPNWAPIRAKYANSQGVVEADNLAKWAAEATAACSVAPKMSAEQVQRLFQKISQGDIDALFSTAQRANFEVSGDTPKSRLASRILEGRDSETS